MIGLTAEAGDDFKNRAAIPLAPCKYFVGAAVPPPVATLKSYYGHCSVRFFVKFTRLGLVSNLDFESLDPGPECTDPQHCL